MLLNVENLNIKRLYVESELTNFFNCMGDLLDKLVLVDLVCSEKGSRK
jgi:hypothetical protein